MKKKQDTIKLLNDLRQDMMLDINLIRYYIRTHHILKLRHLIRQLMHCVYWGRLLGNVM